mmetsp:Transcript_79290/g.139901  ORF Transcript_79290/g.139901 Transcript_79290/m.139901 type:complete len:309 (+) Transcript_79290:297-1223(+)
MRPRNGTDKAPLLSPPPGLVWSTRSPRLSWRFLGPWRPPSDWRWGSSVGRRRSPHHALRCSQPWAAQTTTRTRSCHPTRSLSSTPRTLKSTSSPVAAPTRTRIRSCPRMPRRPVSRPPMGTGLWISSSTPSRTAPPDWIEGCGPARRRRRQSSPPSRPWRGPAVGALCWRAVWRASGSSSTPVASPSLGRWVAPVPAPHKGLSSWARSTRSSAWLTNASTTSSRSAPLSCRCCHRRQSSWPPSSTSGSSKELGARASPTSGPRWRGCPSTRASCSPSCPSSCAPPSSSGPPTSKTRSAMVTSVSPAGT